MLIKDFLTKTRHDFTVDTMVLTSGHAVWWEIRGYFDAWQYFPVLAGRAPCGEPFYIARVEGDNTHYLTCVEDGAQYVRYFDDCGDEHNAEVYDVLVLRHQPPTVTAPDSSGTHRGAMDSTGPLHWLQFWPEKDACYCAVSEFARQDDCHLESLLNSFDGKGDEGVGTWYWN